MPGPERRLAAILSADIAGYSRLMAEDEDATIQMVTARRQQVGLLLEQHRGRLVDFTGDNFLAENWDISRISRIDRILMWMALTEIRSMDDVPVRVSIDEAIELAKRYSAEKAPGFINGILDKLARPNLEEPA